MEEELNESLIGDIVMRTEKATPVVRDEFLEKVDMPKVGTNLHKALVGPNGKTGTKQWQEKQGVSGYNAFDCVEPPYNMDYLAKLYDASSFHAASVDAKIDNVVGLGFYFDYTPKAEKIRQRAAESGDEKKQRVEDKMNEAKDFLAKKLDNLNAEDEFDEILEKFFKDRLTLGNGYIEIGRNLDGSIGYIGHMPAKDVRIRRKRDGFVQYVNNEPIFFRNFGATDPDPFGGKGRPNELIHYKKYSPIDNYYGVPEIVSATEAIAGIKFAQRYNIDYFENKAVPRYIIKTKGVNLTLSQREQLLKFFETTIKGVSHRTILVPLPGGEGKDIEFTPVETGKQEASFQDYINLNTKIILSRHRVPQNRLGLDAGTSLAASRDADKIFKESVCRPEQRIVEKKIDKLVKELTDIFTFRLEQYSLTDEDQQSQIDERYLRHGVYTPDEVRVKRGMGPRPDGKGDEAVDTRSLTELQQAHAEKIETKRLAAQTRQANAAAKTAAATPAAKAPAKKASPAAAAKAESKAQAGQTRTRDQVRASGKTDSTGAASGRRAKGEGRAPGK